MSGMSGKPRGVEWGAVETIPNEGLGAGAAGGSAVSENGAEEQEEFREAEIEREEEGAVSVFQLDPEFDISTAHLIKVFNQLDKDRNGKLSYDELFVGLSGLLRHQASFSEEGLRKLIEEIDTDHSKDISQAEFVHFLQEFAARNAVSTGILHECICYDYTPASASCRFITIEGGDDSISLKAFLKENPRPPPGTVRWVHMSGKNASVILRLSNMFHLSQLEIEDVLNEHEHPKVNVHPNRLHILVNEAAFKRQSEFFRIKTSAFSIFLITEDIVLSFARKRSPIIRVLMERILSPGSKLRLNNARFLVYSILDTLVDNIFSVVKTIESKLDIHQEIVQSTETTITIDNIKSLGATQREIDRIEQWFGPMLAVNSRLLEELAQGDDHLRRYLVDLKEHVITQRDMITRLGKWARSLNQIFVNEQQYKMNQVMYILTMITAIFVPGQFLTGVYGMNFDNLPELHWKWSYLVFWLIVIFLTGLVLYIFHKKGWFRF